MEILNLEYHYKTMTVKALNKTKSNDEAAKLLGISKRKLFDWKIKYNIVRNRLTKEYKLIES